MKLKLYSIILLVCVVLGSCLYFSFNKEGFKADYSDYNTIDRVKDSNGNYEYCIAGKVTCNSGDLIEIKDKYLGGITYDASCSDNSDADCSGNFMDNLSSDALQKWKTPTARGISFPFLSNGFTIPYSYIPVDISGNYIEFYDSSGDLIDSMNKCDMLETEYLSDQCYAALKPKEEPTKTDKTTNKKCIADYGTEIGDSLCCGQKGVLQKYASDYVCPKSTPTCSDFVCGDSYGTCK